jgi:hypothetical protein
MKLLSRKLHGIIDYVSVVLLALAPSLLGLTGLAALLAYVLATVHLAMTLLTAFPLGLAKIVPLRLHGAVEIVVGLSLAILPWALARAVDLGDRGRLFYSAFGVVLCVVFALTDYGAVSARAANARH